MKKLSFDGIHVLLHRLLLSLLVGVALVAAAACTTGQAPGPPPEGPTRTVNLAVSGMT
ncbi:MAG: hypothetical protein ACE5ID_05365 [Acidobacteriota bacterium]